MKWNLASLQRAVEGKLIGEDVAFCGISTDTRTLEKGQLYIAIKGEHFDGHKFIQQALEKGAAAILYSDNDCAVPAGVLVEDTRLALGMFARWHRNEMAVKQLIAVTGSNGKTTTKTMLQAILQNLAPTCVTQGNLNNDFGVPRTLLTIEPEDEYAVIEMGANHLHEIRYLSLLAQPTVSLITNASEAHIEGFGSLQGVIETKGEIVEGLKPKGTAVFNLDSPGIEDWIRKCQQMQIDVMTFGESNQADVHVFDIVSEAQQIQFKLQLKQQLPVVVVMPIIGRHNAINAAAAVTACLAAGLEMAQILPGLVSFQGVEGRLKMHDYQGGVLIDDAYNANPASMRAGIDTLAGLPGEGIACLGAMAELGEQTQQAHVDLGRYAKQQGVTRLFVFGEQAKPIVDGFGEGAKWFESHQVLEDACQQFLKAANATVNILIKGSRSAQMDKVVKALLEEN